MRISHTKAPKLHKPATIASKKVSGGESTRKTVGKKVSGGESAHKTGGGKKVSGGESTHKTGGGKKISGGESSPKTGGRVSGGEYARHVDSFSGGRTRGGE